MHLMGGNSVVVCVCVGGGGKLIEGSGSPCSLYINIITAAITNCPMLYNETQ